MMESIAIEPPDIRNRRSKAMKCPSIRWRTSNMEYGKFYRIAALQARSLPAECNKNRETLNNELVQSKNKLDLLGWQSPGRLPLPRNEWQERLEKSAENNTRSLINQEKVLVHESNKEVMTGMEDNSQKAVHPTKARRLKPRFFPVVRDDFRPPQSASGGGAMAKHKSARTPKKTQNKFSAIHGRLHPATRKYEFYKYYGLGGQGAKTSWGHNLPLGIQPPYGRRSRRILS